MTVTGRGARMRRPSPRNKQGLHGRTVVITRPAGTASALARRVRALGGVPLLLPGLALRGVADAATARTGLRSALAAELIVFTSPAAVRYAAALLPLQTAATVLAVGQGTARALRRHGIAAPLAPRRQDSEGLLEHPALHALRGRRVALIGASGGRGVLREQLAARGAQLHELHVYRRAMSMRCCSCRPRRRCCCPAPRRCTTCSNCCRQWRGHACARRPQWSAANGWPPPRVRRVSSASPRPPRRCRRICWPRPCRRTERLSHPLATNAAVWAASMRA